MSSRHSTWYSPDCAVEGYVYKGTSGIIMVDRQVHNLHIQVPLKSSGHKLAFLLMITLLHQPLKYLE